MRPLPPPLENALRRQGHGLTVVVVRLGAMGDILRALPAVALLRSGLPRARLLWLVEDRWSSVLEGWAALDGVVELRRRAWTEQLRSPLEWPALVVDLWRFRRELRRLEPDLLIDFHGNLRSGIAGRLSSAPVRLGHEGHQQKEGNRLLTTHRIPPGERRRSRVERNLDLLRALGLPDSPLPPLDLPLMRRGAEEADAALRETGVGAAAFAAIAPGASAAQAYKTPPPELLASACRALAGHGVVPLLVWGPGEQSLARRVVEAAGDEVARLAPPTSLPALASLCARARLFVGGDSGPLHLACAAGCPAVALYGPTDPEVNRPWGVPYRILAPPGRSYRGIKRIDRASGGFRGLEPVAVAAAVEDLLLSLPPRSTTAPTAR